VTRSEEYSYLGRRGLRRTINGKCQRVIRGKEEKTGEKPNREGKEGKEKGRIA